MRNRSTATTTKDAGTMVPPVRLLDFLVSKHCIGRVVSTVLFVETIGIGPHRKPNFLSPWWNNDRLRPVTIFVADGPGSKTRLVSHSAHRSLLQHPAFDFDTHRILVVDSDGQQQHGRRWGYQYRRQHEHGWFGTLRQEADTSPGLVSLRFDRCHQVLFIDHVFNDHRGNQQNR